MRLRSRVPQILALSALVGLMASMSVGCLCAAERTSSSMPCHREAPGTRLDAACCCEVSPQSPGVVERLRTTELPARSALGLSEPSVRIDFVPEDPSAYRVGDRFRIDRSPPPASGSPLRI